MIKVFNSKNKFISKSSFESGNWIPYTKHDYTKFNPVNTWFEFVNRLIRGDCWIFYFNYVFYRLVNLKK